MRPVTGSNTPQAGNTVSIQRSLDGHSFSEHGLDGEFPGEEPVEAELLTAPQTDLVLTMNAWDTR